MKRIQLSLILLLATLYHNIKAQEWTDVTDVFITNPSFNSGSTGWEMSGWCGSFGTVNYGCMEFWNGWFDVSQKLSGMPPGKYRLSVQAYYRCGDYSAIYQTYTSGQETVTAFLYAGNDDNYREQPVNSVFAHSFTDVWGGGWWSPDNHYYYPDNMQQANNVFSQGKYWNTIEFEADGETSIGLYCYESAYSNWCIFDNFKLEYSGEVVKAQSVSVEAPKTELLVGETMQLTATVLPENTMQKNVTWTTSNASKATVSDDGLVTATGAGSVKITATTTDGSNKRGSVILEVVRNEATPGSIVINEIMASNVDEFISPAFNFDGWMELYNPTERDVELTGLVLSDGNGEQWKLPAQLGIIQAGGFKVIWFDSNNIAGQNAPFKLDVDGGTIAISNAAGQQIATATYPASMERVSYARTTDGGETWGHTSTATPGESNDNSVFATQQLAAPTVDLPSQLFSGRLSVNVTIPAGCTLRYTTDGSLPTAQSTVSRGQFTISKTTCLRLRLFANGMLASPVTSRSYIYKDRDYYLPVVSVIADEDFLYSSEIGVMAMGPNGRPGNGQSSNCNWNMDWERPVNFSYIDANGEMVLNQDVNLEMCGGWSRAWTPHSFKLKGNKELGGSKNLGYQFFTDKPYIRNRTLQIRNGGNDTGCRIKDPSLQYIVQSSGIDMDLQSYEPIHEFINGEYIGVLNVREPNNKHYVYANYGWDDDEIDQFEMSPDSGYVQRCGTPDAYNMLVDELSPSAANSETYDEICRMLDIDEYINYMATEFYLCGTDWPQNNVKAFRHKDGGKFRFVLFDLDGTFATDNPFNNFMWKEQYTFDQLYPTYLGRITDHIRFVTLFKNLLNNSDFRRKFIDTYSLIGGSVFEATRSRQIINELVSRVDPAMALEGRSASGTASQVINSLNNRLQPAINSLRNFESFNLSNKAAKRVKLSSDTEGAQLMVNGLQVPTGRFNGYLFDPVTLRALAPAGYAFQGWSNGGNTENTTIKAMGTTWSYYDQGSLDGTNWTSPTYDESGWKKGNAPLGYGNPNVQATTTLDYGGNAGNKRPTYYFRTKVDFSSVPTEVTLDYVVDDGVIVYVNGSEAARYNMPSGNVTYSTYASTYAYNNPENGTLTLPANLFRQGSNTIAVELHNNSANSTDILWDASINAQVASATQSSYISTKEEISLPQGSNLDLVACYRPLTDAERAEQGYAPVSINEVSGSNSALINEYGKKDDWLELYNNTNEDIDLEGMFLTDDTTKPEKYQIAKNGTNVNTVIPAHGYLIVWCDKRETTNQALHASFKISGAGGKLMLTAADRSWHDVLTYGTHDGNSTVGRFPDGAGTVYTMNVPTIGRSNIVSSYVEQVEQTGDNTNRIMDIASANGFRIRYGAQLLIVKSDDDGPTTIELFTTDGRLIERQPTIVTGGIARLSVAHLPAGFYVARATNDEGTRVACKFMR